MIKIISAFLLFTLGVLHAQTSPGSQTTANTENLKTLGSGGWTSNIQTFDNRYEGVKGSPNVFEEWQSGRVYFRDGDHVKSHAYLLYSKDFLRASTDGGYSPDRRNDEFVDKQELYFQKHDDVRMYRLKKSRKYILECFPDKESEIKAFLKSEKPDLKSPAGLSALLAFYDSL